MSGFYYKYLSGSLAFGLKIIIFRYKRKINKK